MKLFRITRITASPDEPYSHVIRAFSEKEARSMAVTYGGCPSAQWTDPSHSSCDEISIDGPAHIVLSAWSSY